MANNRTIAAEDSLRARLEMGVHKDMATGCWAWTKACDAKGYPRIKHRGEALYAYRASLSVYRNVPLEAKVRVTRSCGNRKCINPDHLVVDNAD